MKFTNPFVLIVPITALCGFWALDSIKSKDVRSLKVSPMSANKVTSSEGIALQRYAILASREATTAWQQGNLLEARQKFEAIKVKTPDIYPKLAELCKVMGDQDAQLKYLRIMHDPNDGMGSSLDNDPLALLEYAEVLEKESPAEAEVVYQRIASVGMETISGDTPQEDGPPLFPKIPKDIPLRAQVFGRIALSQWMDDKYTAAQESIEEAAKVAGDDPVIAYYGSLMAYEVKDAVSARNLLEKSKAKNKGEIRSGSFEYLEPLIIKL